MSGNCKHDMQPTPSASGTLLVCSKCGHSRRVGALPQPASTQETKH
jgi:hypothetical protein